MTVTELTYFRGMWPDEKQCRICDVTIVDGDVIVLDVERVPGRFVRHAWCAEVVKVAPKVCAKCSGPIPSPLLGDDPAERCPLCGDEPASRAELAELLRAALHGGVVAVRDHLEGMAGEWQRGAFRALDDALDDIDSAVRYLESDDYEDECGCVEGVLVGQTYGCTSPPETAILVQRCDACDLYDGDLAAAVGYVSILGYGRAHAIGDGENLVEQSDVWVDPGGTLGPVVWHSEEYAVAAGWINRPEVDEVSGGS